MKMDDGMDVLLRYHERLMEILPTEEEMEKLRELQAELRDLSPKTRLADAFLMNIDINRKFCERVSRDQAMAAQFIRDEEDPGN